MNIGVDLDGVLANFVREFIIQARERYDINIKPKDITSFKLENTGLINKEQVMSIVNDKDVYINLIPFRKGIEIINNIFHKKNKIWIITTRPIDSYKITLDWLINNNVLFDNLIITKDKFEISKNNKIKIFIEDNDDIAIGLSKICKQVYLIDRLYNQGELPDNVYRIEDWNEIREAID